jgi:hypothetical protein
MNKVLLVPEATGRDDMKRIVVPAVLTKRPEIMPS